MVAFPDFNEAGGVIIADGKTPRYEFFLTVMHAYADDDNFTSASDWHGEDGAWYAACDFFEWAAASGVSPDDIRMAEVAKVAEAVVDGVGDDLLAQVSDLFAVNSALVGIFLGHVARLE